MRHDTPYEKLLKTMDMEKVFKYAMKKEQNTSDKRIVQEEIDVDGHSKFNLKEVEPEVFLNTF